MWARHASTSECDPANYDRVNRKPKCMAAGCREKLTITNRFDCKVSAVKTHCPSSDIISLRILFVVASFIHRRSATRLEIVGRSMKHSFSDVTVHVNVCVYPYAHEHKHAQECGASVCLRHRFGDDHQCTERRQRVAELRKRARMSIWGGRGRAGDGKKNQQDRNCMKNGCSLM